MQPGTCLLPIGAPGSPRLVALAQQARRTPALLVQGAGECRGAPGLAPALPYNLGSAS